MTEAVVSSDSTGREAVVSTVAKAEIASKHGEPTPSSSSSSSSAQQNSSKDEYSHGDDKIDDPAETPQSVSRKDDAKTEQSHDRKNETCLSRWRRAYGIFAWTPPRCRWNPRQPPKFSMLLNILFGFAGAFTVANLYYTHPILNILAADFGVEYVQVAQIPTLAQAGYAIGLLLLCPLGDLLKRRPFVLYLVFLTASLRLVHITSERACLDTY